MKAQKQKRDGGGAGRAYPRIAELRTRRTSVITESGPIVAGTPQSFNTSPLIKVGLTQFILDLILIRIVLECEDFVPAKLYATAKRQHPDKAEWVRDKKIARIGKFRPLGIIDAQLKASGQTRSSAGMAKRTGGSRQAPQQPSQALSSDPGGPFESLFVETLPTEPLKWPKIALSGRLWRIRFVLLEASHDVWTLTELDDADEGRKKTGNPPIQMGMNITVFGIDLSREDVPSQHSLPSSANQSVLDTQHSKFTKEQVRVARPRTVRQFLSQPQGQSSTVIERVTSMNLDEASSDKGVLFDRMSRALEGVLGR